MASNGFSRRGFLRAMAGSTVAVSAGTLAGAVTATPAGASPSAAAAGRRGGRRLLPTDRLSIQLYSVRTMVAQRGFRAVFEELSRIGYREVEFAGYTQGDVGPITVEEIRQLLDDNGLRVTGSHVGLTALRDDLELELDRAEILGMTHLGTASRPTDEVNAPDSIGGVHSVAGYQSAADEFNSWGEVAADRGIKLYQHNHTDEFRFATDDPDVRVYDVFLEHTDESLVYLEMDIYWAFAGQHLYPGFEPVEYVTEDPCRYPLFHLKDGEINLDNPNGYDIVEFGAGDIPFREFFSALESRAFYPIWEQDNAIDTPPELGGPFGAAERSFDAMYDLRCRPSRGHGGHGHGNHAAHSSSTLA